MSKYLVTLLAGFSNFGCDGLEYPVDENQQVEMPGEAFSAAQGMGIVESFELIEDEDELDPEDEKLFDILALSVAKIEDAMAGLNAEQLNRLKELEDANANRKGVDSLIQHALAQL